MACAIAVQLKPGVRSRRLLRQLRHKTPGVRWHPGRDERTFHAEFTHPYVTWQQGQHNLKVVLDRIDPWWDELISFGPSITYANPG